MEENVVIIFAKEPMPGKVKTRLARSIGNELAVKLYELFLRKTLTILENLDYCTAQLFKTRDSAEDYFQGISKTEIFEQEGADFGERMKNAFTQVFAAGAERAVIIGTDCPEVDNVLLKKAFVELLKKEVVIGPATDGGYYLLGLKKEHPYLFENMAWSTVDILIKTEKKLNEKNITYTKLDLLSDIDTRQDLDFFLDNTKDKILKETISTFISY